MSVHCCGCPLIRIVTLSCFLYLCTFFLVYLSNLVALAKSDISISSRIFVPFTLITRNFSLLKGPLYTSRHFVSCLSRR